MNELKDRRILIVGATGDIGQAIAKELHEAGSRVYLAGRNADKLAALTRELGGDTSPIPVWAGDLTGPGSAKSLLQSVPEAWGGLDAVVSAFGVAEADLAVRPKWDVWQRAFDINVRALAELCSAGIAVLRKSPGSSLISIVSTAGKEGVAGRASYSASKGAQRAYLDSLRHEAQRHGVRVVSICPARVDSRLQPEADRPSLIPPKDIAAAVLFALRLGRNTGLSEITLDNTPSDATGS